MEKALSAIFHPGRSKHIDKQYGRQSGTIYSIETMRNMSANVHQFGRFVKDNWPEVRRVEQITPGMAQAYIDELVRRERSGGWIDRVLLTLRGLASGSDGFEEWARLQVGARLHLDIPPSAWYRTLPQLLPGERFQPTGFALPAYLGEKNTSLVRAFLAGIHAAGGDPGFVLKTSTADRNLVAPAWGCPALAYGPGDSSLDHTPDEHILLGEYRQAVAVLPNVLTKLIFNQGVDEFAYRSWLLSLNQFFL